MAMNTTECDSAVAVLCCRDDAVSAWVSPASLHAISRMARGLLLLAPDDVEYLYSQGGRDAARDAALGLRMTNEFYHAGDAEQAYYSNLLTEARAGRPTFTMARLLTVLNGPEVQFIHSVVRCTSSPRAQDRAAELHWRGVQPLLLIEDAPAPPVPPIPAADDGLRGPAATCPVMDGVTEPRQMCSPRTLPLL